MFVARLVGGTAGASFAVANAYASDVTPPEERAKGFGLVGAAFGLGFIFGPMIGGLLGSDRPALAVLSRRRACRCVNAAYGSLRRAGVAAARAPFAVLARARANPFAALAHARPASARSAAWSLVFALVVLAQLMLQMTWVLYTHFRFGWGPRENGFALFCVGLVADRRAGRPARAGCCARFGDVRLALVRPRASAPSPTSLYGLAPARAG